MSALYTNNAATTLASGINNSVTSLTVASATGGLFPSPTGTDYFYVTLENTAGTVREIVKVTARSTDTLTIVRGQDGTSAQTFATGDKVELRIVAAEMSALTSGLAAGGSTTQVQYNSSGAFAGSANMTFNGTTFTLANDASISGLTVGKGTNGIASNTAVGASALVANSSGSNNAAFGNGALYTNSTGASNTALGYFAALSTSTGSNNVAVGTSALQTNTTASNNTAVGYQAGYSNTTGAGVTALGFSALYSNTTGDSATALGYQALYSNTTGTGLTAIGRNALFKNTTGYANIAIGGYDSNSGNNGALFNNTTGSANTAVGSGALLSNTTASQNTAIGYQAMYSNTTSAGTTAIGRVAGYAYNGASEANGSVFCGNASGYTTTSGRDNTFIGASSGYYVTTGSKNTILGQYTGNQGGLDIRTASNYIVLSDGDGNPRAYCTGAGDWTTQGNITGGSVIAIGQTTFRATSSVGTGYMGFIGTATAFQVAFGSTSAGVQLGSGATSWASFSDQRLKNVTGTYTNALADISQIQPVKFTWKSDTKNKPQVGVLAQSVQAVVPEAVEALTMEMDSPDEYLTVRYTELIPLMIASIQELKAEVDSLKQQLGK